MMDFLRKHMRIIFLITIIGFLAGAFIGFGGYFFGEGASADTAAEVNGEKISYRRYSSVFNRMLENARQNKMELTEDMMTGLRQQVLQDLIQEEVFWKESKKYGITVSDAEVAADIQHFPAFQRDGRFDQRAYFQVLYQVLRTTPKEFEEDRRRQIAIFKLRRLIASSIRISEPELRLEYARTHGGKLDDFAANRQKFLEGLQQEKVSMVFNEWFKQINQTLKVKVYLKDVQQGRGA
jgi:peptidyl-prolyl cis-trans isomerase D